MTLALSRIFASLVVGGLTIGAPTIFYTNSSTAPKISNNASGRTTSSRPLTSQERQFYNCLDKGIKLRITDIQDQKTFEVPVSERSKYLDRSKWTVDVSYGGQCRQYNQ